MTPALRFASRSAAISSASGLISVTMDRLPWTSPMRAVYALTRSTDVKRFYCCVSKDSLND